MDTMSEKREPAVTWKSYVAFFGALIFFREYLLKRRVGGRSLTFSVLNGSFGPGKPWPARRHHSAAAAGTGARDGFMFALTLLFTLIFAIAIIHVVEGYGGLRVAERFLSSLLRPLLGIPGICGLAMIANLQTTDAAAGMTKVLYEEGN